MTAKSSCPNGRRLWAEWERLRAQWEEARKRRAALEAEVRRGRRSAAPFPGMSRYRAVIRGGSRPPEEVIRETVAVPLEACPACGGPRSYGHHSCIYFIKITKQHQKENEKQNSNE
jgi:hypothetical protein